MYPPVRVCSYARNRDIDCGKINSVRMREHWWTRTYVRTRSGCGCSGCRQGALRWRLSDLSDQGMTVKQNRMQSCMRSAVITVFIVAVSYLPLCECALVSQSSIAMCNHGDSSEPTGEGGNPCEKKMLVSMTLRGGQVAASCMRSLPMW